MAITTASHGRFSVNVVWRADDAVKVPVGALFRRDGKWTVFAVAGGRAVARAIEVGLRGARDAEVLSGLADKDEIVLYPGNELAEGARVQPRK